MLEQRKANQPAINERLQRFKGRYSKEQIEEMLQYRKGEQSNLSPIQNTINEAAKIAGVEPKLMQAMAGVESSYNPSAKSLTSSAAGLYQFTKDTWGNMVNRYGQQYGIKRNDILNPKANAIMAGLLLKENSNNLQKKIKRQPTNGELYIAHFMGVNNASRLINSLGKGKKASLMFKKAAMANKPIFFAGNKARTAEEVYQILTSKIDNEQLT